MFHMYDNTGQRKHACTLLCAGLSRAQPVTELSVRYSISGQYYGNSSVCSKHKTSRSTRQDKFENRIMLLNLRTYEILREWLPPNHLLGQRCLDYSWIKFIIQLPNTSNSRAILNYGMPQIQAYDWERFPNRHTHKQKGEGQSCS